MVREDPLFEENLTYSAHEVRLLLDELFVNEGVTSAGGLLVSERAAGANMSVDVAAGVAVIKGDDETNQGKYMARSTAVESVVIGANASGNPRIDRIIARVRDSEVTGASNDWIITVVQGVPAGSPVAPALPASAISLATVDVASGAVSIVDADITDVRPRASTVPDESIGTAQLVNAAVTADKLNEGDTGVITVQFAGDARLGVPILGTSVFTFQGGTFTGTTTAGGDLTVVFPEPFPNGIVAFVACNGDQSAGGAFWFPAINSADYTVNGVAVKCIGHDGTPLNGQAVRIDYIAIGW